MAEAESRENESTSPQRAHIEAPAPAPAFAGTTPPRPADPCTDSARDLAVELVKLFITFATAGIAFLVGAVISGMVVLSTGTITACLALFAASVISGILFFMQAVSLLRDDQ